jgi:hypothetical protein
LSQFGVVGLRIREVAMGETGSWYRKIILDERG